MRSIIIAFLLLTFIALAWAVQAPASAYWSVWTFSRSDGDCLAAEDALLRAGTGAMPALNHGLRSPNANVRFHCAKVLAVLGENAGEEFLFATIRAHPDPADVAGREAEAFLLAAWDRRNGPDGVLRQKLREAEGRELVPVTLQALNECLAVYPTWADGYARRARLYQQAGEAFDARRDALNALTLAPNHFEAMVTLGRVQMSVDSAQQAYACFERALLVNPRLKNALKDDIREALRVLEIEKGKQRDEKRRASPLV